MKEGIFINQTKYTKYLLKKFEMENAITLETFMNPSTKINTDEIGKPVNENRYQGLIRSLLYLTTSKLDIMFNVCLCVRYQSNLKEFHPCIVKRIFRYLLGTKNFRLWYPKGS